MVTDIRQARVSSKTLKMIVYASGRIRFAQQYRKPDITRYHQLSNGFDKLSINPTALQTPMTGMISIL